jgi:hypothetical protein
VLAAVCESCEMGNSRVSEEDYREGRNLSMVKLAKGILGRKEWIVKILKEPVRDTSRQRGWGKGRLNVSSLMLLYIALICLQTP